MTRTVFVLLLMSSIGNLSAQPKSFVPFEGLADGLRSLSSSHQAEIASVLTENTQEFVWYSLGSAVYASFVEEGRIDKQVGASAGNSGSTSLVSKGSVPALIGVAVESGALYQSVSGDIVTFRMNPAGFARALTKRSYLLAGAPADESALEKIISRMAGSASFDFQQGPSPGTFTGERSQLKEVAVRFNLINRRDPRHPSHKDVIARVSDDMKSLVGTVQDIFDKLRDQPEYENWRITSAKKLQNVDFKDDPALLKALFEIGDSFKRIYTSNPDLRRLGKNMVEDVSSYRKTRNDVFETIAGGSTLSFEYAFNRMEVPEEALLSLNMMHSALPDLSTARLILSSPIGKVGEVTTNASITIFNSTLPQMKGNLRDMQIAGSMDFRLPELQSVGQPVITFAFLGAFLHQQPFGVRVKLKDFETKDGFIGVLQAKLTLPAGRSGARIPMSFTLANRSEFNTETELRGSIGLTFNLDTLFSRP